MKTSNESLTPNGQARRWTRFGIISGAATLVALILIVLTVLGNTSTTMSQSENPTKGNAEPSTKGESKGVSSNAISPQLEATSDIGYRDFSWAAPSVGEPTTEKPQSKLWFNDGIWWGSLFDRTTEQYYIYKLDSANQTWTNTGTLIDTRNSSRADCLWDGTHLYVATGTATSSTTGDEMYVLRYSYNSATQSYTQDTGFPVVIGDGVMEGLVLDKDSTGQIWATYTQSSTLYLNRTLGDDATWGTSFTPVLTGTMLSPDDTSALVAYDSKIGLLWSNQLDDAFYFSYHNDADPDETWQPSVALIQGQGSADDHINLKAMQNDPAGKLFAAVKTGYDEVQPIDPNANLVLLLVLGSDDVWTTHLVGRVMDDETRPIVEIDQENREVYVIESTAISGTIPSGLADTAIYYKKSSLDNIAFPAGKGTPFIQSRNDIHINSPASTKQNLTGASGLVVIAADRDAQTYWHNSLSFYTNGSCTLTDFTDVPSGSTFYPFVRCLACRSVLGGYPDGTFQPSNNITRGQIAKVVSNSANFQEDAGAQIFEDVPQGSTFYNWVNRLTLRGIINGYPCGGAGEPCGSGNKPYFRTGANATRGQISKIVSEAAGFIEERSTQNFEDVQPGSTFYLWVERLASRQVINGYPCGGLNEPCGNANLPYFRPNANVSRGQAAKIVSNTFFPDCNP